MADLSGWIGRTEERRDSIRTWPVEALHAALDLPGDPPQHGDPLPPFWRWLYFLEARRRGDLGRDGHPERGYGVTPPIALPRRMWAGGRCVFHKPLRIGVNATRLSTILDVTEKEGRSGPLCFLTLRHETLTSEGKMETEEQDIVYLRDPDPNEPRPAPPEARRDEIWRRSWTADAPLLFRYSALTYNSHRIHYDIDYCREVEGYDGLVVHGPLLATLMLELAHERGPDQRVAAFSFRAVSPVIDSEAFEICGRPKRLEDGREAADLWVRAPDLRGQILRLAMKGEVIWG